MDNVPPRPAEAGSNTHGVRRAIHPIMDNAALLGAIRERLAELASTQAAVLTKEEALRLVSRQ
jgi:hypothetical protein